MQCKYCAYGEFYNDYDKHENNYLSVNKAITLLKYFHKLRETMGKRDGEYVLAGSIELDEGYFSTETPEAAKNELLKRGRGSQRKSKVIVMAESTVVEPTKKGQKARRVGYLKMKVIENLQKETINGQVQKLASNATAIDSDDSTSYVDEGFCAQTQCTGDT
ncbi:hypothetical protein FACS189429_5440 [Bacteroidia bacterium]|nr:hypothetical protein FACS189429_5440 [Bacteroidia bacterium]GHV44346.1 hypothetical protein FACS1894180_5590 [Bacteroidia bacterium]